MPRRVAVRDDVSADDIDIIPDVTPVPKVAARRARAATAAAAPKKKAVRGAATAKIAAVSRNAAASAPVSTRVPASADADESDSDADISDIDEDVNKKDAKDADADADTDVDVDVGADNADASDSDEDSDDEDAFDDFVPTGSPWSEESDDVEYRYIDAKDRRTVGVLGQHAAAALIAIRTTQIANTGLSTVEDTGCDTNEDIARKELMEGKFPIMIRRVAGSRIVAGKKIVEYELWRTNELILPVGI